MLILDGTRADSARVPSWRYGSHCVTRNTAMLPDNNIPVQQFI